MPDLPRDKVPAGFKPKGWTTYKNKQGQWRMKPTGLVKGREDKTLRPRIIVKPPKKR